MIISINKALHQIRRLPFGRLAICLHTKTSYSRLTKHQTLKLNAKTGGGALPPEPPLNCLWLAIGCRRTKDTTLNKAYFSQYKSSDNQYM